MEDVYKKLYEDLCKKNRILTDDLEWYKNAYAKETHYTGKYVAELEKRKKDEARAFCRGVFVTCVTALVVLGIMCVYAR